MDKLWYYEWEDGGEGICKAENVKEAEKKIRESYKKHGYGDTSEKFYVYPINIMFDDSPDVIEINKEEK